MHRDATHPSADRNLLFGILALQMDFLSRDQLVAGMQAWALAKSTPLGDLLVRQKSLAEEHHRLLDALVDAHLRQHHNDPRQSLASLPGVAAAASQLRDLPDEQLQQSLATLQTPAANPGESRDPYATISAAELRTGPPDETRYQLVRPHAEGGLGRVFVARDLELGREVAVKEIKPGRAQDQASRLRFMREAEITGGLEHPGIVPVYSLGAYPDGRPYYAMRFIRGESLKDAIDEFHRPSHSSGASLDNRELQLRRLLQRLVAVCEAIDYAHSRGVLHRDLKPANIMLGQYGETLVVDWGLAKATGKGAISEDPLDSDRPRAESFAEGPLLPASDSASEPTVDGSALGTPGFLSPEQAQGRLDLIGPTTDVFSLGATLYALLTGRPPYHRDDPLASARAGRFPAPRELSPAIPRPLEAICLRAMAVTPADRYPSARELARDLERYLADQPVTAYRDRSGERIGRWARHNRSWVLAGASALAIVCGVSIAAAGATYRAWSESKSQERAAVAARGAAVQAQLAAEELAERNAEIAKQEREQREQSERLAREKVELANEKSSLADFLIGIFQASDPIGMGGVDFFIPRQDSENLTAAHLLDRGAKLAQAEGQFAENRAGKAAVLHAIGSAYRQLGDFDRARPLLEEALTIRRQLPAVERAELADSCFQLGWCLHETGDFPKARPLYEEALALQRTLTDSGGVRRTAAIQRNLAWMLAYEGDTDEAERLFRQTIEELSHAADRPGKDLAIAKFGLAFTLIDAGKHEFAGPVVIDAQLEWRNSQQNPDFNSAATNFCLGVIARNPPRIPGLSLLLTKDDQLRKSESYLREARDTFAKAAGNEHYVTGVMRFELGRTLWLLKRYDEAEQEFRAGLQIARDKVHLKHPRLITAFRDLGRFFKERGKADEGRRIWSDFVEAQRRHFGAKHPYVARALYSQAQFLISLRDDEAADTALAECLAIGAETPGVEPGLAECALASRGFCALRRKQLAEAETQLSAAVEQLRDRTSRRHDLPYELIQALVDLATCRHRQGRTDAGLAEIERAEAAAKSYSGSESRRTDSFDYVFEAAADIHQEAGNLQQAVDYCLRRRALWKGDSSSLIRVARELAQCAALAAAATDPNAAKLRELSVRETLATLQAAVRANPDTRRRDVQRFAEFATLKDVSEYQQLLESLPESKSKQP